MKILNQKIFALIVTFDAFSKNSFASYIERNFETVKASNNSFAQNIVDMKILKKKIFDFIMLFDQKSKNSFVLYSENIEVSIAMNMSFSEHFINENISITEIFDYSTAINASSKNPFIQQTKHSKTMKKISESIVIDFASDLAHIFYELSAFSAFDFSLDIDFEIYIIDSKVTCSNIQFSVASSKEKMQLLSFRDLALRNKSFD